MLTSPFFPHHQTKAGALHGVNDSSIRVQQRLLVPLILLPRTDTHYGYSWFQSAPGHWTVHSGASLCVCTVASFQWKCTQKEPPLISLNWFKPPFFKKQGVKETQD